MRNSCKAIVFTGIISIITIITTWLIATNELVSELLGNADAKQFALTISGGLFTGAFVLMLTEVHRYCNLKEDISVENGMIRHDALKTAYLVFSYLIGQ